MTIQRAFTIIIISGVVAAMLGALLGVAIGYFAPSYYREMFDGYREHFCPMQIGAVLGLTQGVVVGLIVGAVATLAVAIASRSQKV